MEPTYDEYLKAQSDLNELYDLRNYLISEAEKIMSTEYDVSDEMYLDEIYAEQLPIIDEKIQKLNLICKAFTSNFNIDNFNIE
jgi:hypothetical protein